MRFTKAYINEHYKSYKHCARLQLTGNVLRIVNTGTGCIHPFVGGEEEFKLSQNDLRKVTNWLSDIY